jgi:hypothetical protein
MDPLDGWRNDHPEEGIYEHITRKWLPSRRIIHFAGMWEWVIQAFAAVWFIAISANLSQLFITGGQFGTLAYLGIFSISAVFDAKHRAPKRSQGSCLTSSHVQEQLSSMLSREQNLRHARLARNRFLMGPRYAHGAEFV